jgi:hypothetical protein
LKTLLILSKLEYLLDESPYILHQAPPGPKEGFYNKKALKGMKYRQTP